MCHYDRQSSNSLSDTLVVYELSEVNETALQSMDTVTHDYPPKALAVYQAPPRYASTDAATLRGMPGRRRSGDRSIRSDS